MNWGEMQGSWKAFLGRMREQWGKLTHNDFAVIAGRRDQLVGMIQQRYGATRKAAEERVAALERRYANVVYRAQ